MKITRNIIKEIENEARKYFVDATGCHDFRHVERVYNLALNIGKKEKADLSVLAVAALLHDVGRKEEMKSRGKLCHAEKGREIAKKILGKYKLDSDIVENILHCIITHRYRNQHIPNTIEAKVLFDADKLDGLGAVGIGRIFLFAGFFKNPLYTGRERKLAKSKINYSYSKEDTAVLEYEIKLKHVQDRMLTKTGKKMARKRHDFMALFFKRFWEEIKGVE